MTKKKVFLVFGTRPEAIKMAPVAIALKHSVWLDVRIVITAQHRQMLDQVVSLFDLKVDYDLNLMQPNQRLSDFTCSALRELCRIFDEEQPDLVLVHGDTATTFAAGLAAFYNKTLVGHIEAGLRTGNPYSPFPEEMNRRLTACLTTYHFAPTEQARQNLLNENIDTHKIVVTGNTVIDALFAIREKIKTSKNTSYIESVFKRFPGAKTILVTAHRRENFGKGIANLCKAIRKLVHVNHDVHVVFPVHPNPNVSVPVYAALQDVTHISLIEPLDYESFVYAMSASYFILTDSCGVQEEAPSLGIPVLVVRENTERNEGLEAGATKLVGTSAEGIFSEAHALLYNEVYHAAMRGAYAPYGDGKASGIIRQFLEKELCQQEAELMVAGA